MFVLVSEQPLRRVKLLMIVIGVNLIPNIYTDAGNNSCTYVMNAERDNRK